MTKNKIYNQARCVACEGKVWLPPRWEDRVLEYLSEGKWEGEGNGE